MSIDLYTGVVGGGAVAQFHRSLGDGWQLEDHTANGCIIEAVPTGKNGALITLTIGGNNLYLMQDQWLASGLGEFQAAHRELLGTIRIQNPDSIFVVGNVYAPQFPLDAARLALLEEANAIIEENAASIGARLVDIRSAFRGHEDSYLCSQIAPTLKGATVIGRLFREAYESAC